MTSISSSLSAAKTTLRVEMKRRLSGMSQLERIAQSKIITEKVLASEFYKKSRRLCFYLSLPEEVSTMNIMQDALTTGKLCFIPRYEKIEMKMLRLFSLEDFDNLPLTKWNIKQPEMSEDREDALQSGGLDLVLVPGLAFTTSGQRLGRGKGYYDEFLRKCKSTETPPVVVGLSFTEQLVPEIPMIPGHDENLDYVLHP